MWKRNWLGIGICCYCAARVTAREIVCGAELYILVYRLENDIKHGLVPVAQR